MKSPQRLDLETRAERYRLLADPTRLAIVEALVEGPREVGELARIAGVHRNTIRAHLARLDQAGLLTSETAPPAGRGRPALRYRLREPALLSGGEFRILVDGLVRVVQRCASAEAAHLAEAEGFEVGRRLGVRLRYPSARQAVDQVMGVLRQLAFSPELERGREAFRIRLRTCPFGISARDGRGTVVCSFHLGIIRGIVDVAAPPDVERVDLFPFASPSYCQAEIRFAAAS
jgi:predicted ArsR family transcriptional regulator